MTKPAAVTGQQWLAQQPIDDHPEAEQLLFAQLKLSRAQWLADSNRELVPADLDVLNGQAARLHQGEPLAYILGHQGFWDMDLKVTPAVLIPRPDTELLVELAIETIKTLAQDNAGPQTLSVCELGTGSGAIALALARTPVTTGVPGGFSVGVTACDICPGALDVAQHNAQRYPAHKTNRLTFMHSDWFNAFAHQPQFHLVVSNPPYVAADDPHLPALRHEPQQALVAGPEGLDALRTLAEQAPAYLKTGGWLLLEHGYNQGSQVRQLLIQSGLQKIATHQDLGGNDRVTLGQKN